MEYKNYSLADQIFELLEQDILSGKYAPGTILTENGLVKELRVGRPPIRETMRRLAQERLIADEEDGFRVIGISRDDLIDIMEIRLRLEGIAAARAAERITEDELLQLTRTVELQEFYLSKGDAEEIKCMDSRFHTLIYKFSGSTVFSDTLAPLHKKVQSYRKAAIENRSRAEESVREHREILNAIAAHDKELAAERIVWHAENAKKHIENSMKI